jgi:2-methylisocitrate lyase-like PEP mutase family enzyme
VAAATGLPDGHAATRDASLTLARTLGNGSFHLSVDAGNGFSDDPEEVAGTARELAAAGVAGINLEDGRPDGSLAPAELHAAKIAAVKAAVPDLFVNARTDTHWLRNGDGAGSGPGTIRRLDAYRQAGADGVFVPGLSDPRRITALLGALDVPLNILYSPAGPAVPALADLGVSRVSLGSLLYRRALGAALETASLIRAGRPVEGATPTYEDVQELM